MSLTLEHRRLILPPPYTQHVLENGDVMAEATRRAPAEGAGTLIWQHRPGLLAFSVVLEPEQALGEARIGFLVAMVALAEALVAHCPPERAVGFGWPGTLYYDRARIGGARLAVESGCAEDETPGWMVFCAELIADRDDLDAPGVCPESTSLKEEEFVDPGAIVESFAAYLMLNFDRMAHGGIEALTSRYIQRLDLPSATGLPRITPACEIIHPVAGGGERVSRLQDGLDGMSWRDPVTGSPRL